MGNMVKINSYAGPKTILIAPELAFSIPVIVTNTGIGADTNGRKIIKAGTPIGGETNVLLNRQTALIKDETNAQGILLHNVDVTEGETNATMLVSGYVDLTRIETDTVPSEIVQNKLNRIVFMKGE